MIVRYCRRCDEEFQPHIVRCSDCGGELEDRYPDSATVEDQARIEDGAAESEFETVARDLSARKAELVARRLGDAGIPFRVAAQSYGQGFGFVLSVRKQDEPATRQILWRARALPRSAPEDEPADDHPLGDREPDDREREPRRVEDRQERRLREVDLLAGRRGLDDLVLVRHRRYWTYTQAATNVMANMKSMIAHVMNAVRRFLRARRRSMVRAAVYKRASSTIAQNRSAR